MKRTFSKHPPDKNQFRFAYLYAKYEPMPSPIFCGSDTVISMKKSECSSVEISSIALLMASGWKNSHKK